MNMAWRYWDIRYLAVIASLLLSGLSALNASLPNDDAYTYLRTAEIFLNDGIGAAISHYTWAGYPILIGITSLTGLSLLQAAYTLNAIFYGLLVFSYISIVRQIDNSKLTAYLGALTVLAYPELNEYRDMVIRDIGYWSLCLFAIWRFMIYRDSRQFSALATFVIVMIAAALFRAEALIYLLAIPLVLLLDRRFTTTENQLAVWKALGFTAVISALGILTARTVGINIPTMLLKLLAVYEPFLAQWSAPTEITLAAQAKAIFGDFSALIASDYLHTAVLLGLPIILVTSLFYTIGGPYFWLLVFGAVRGMLRWDVEQIRPLFVVALVNFLITLGFLYLTRFLTGRYAMMFGIMVSMLVPVLWQEILTRFRSPETVRALRLLFIVFFSYCMIDAYVTFGRSKDWLIDSANFARTATPDGAQILTNNHTIAYLSDRVTEYDELTRELRSSDILKLPPGTLIALELIPEIRQLVNQETVQAQIKLLAAFPDTDEPQAAIYERVSPQN